MLDSLLNTISTSMPEGFDDDSVTPYGTKQDEVFTLIEKDEIFAFVSKGDSVSEAWLMDDVSCEISLFGLSNNYYETVTWQSGGFCFSQ